MVSALAVVCVTACAASVAPTSVAPDAAQHAAGAVGLSPTDLGTLGGSYSQASAINASGQVVGSSETATGLDHAFLWTRSGGLIDLGAPTGGNSAASDINDAGVIVGSMGLPSGDVHAFRWSPRRKMVDIGTLGGHFTYATAINGWGEIVGVATTATSHGAYHAFRWTSSWGLQDLGPLGSTPGASASVGDVNIQGTIAGSYSDPNSGARHAVLQRWFEEVVPLPDLGGQPALAALTGINAYDEVVGTSGTVAGATHAALWSSDRGILDLGTLGGSSASAAAISDAGWVVGYGGAPSDIGEIPRAFLWTRAAGLRTLPTLGGATNDAAGINADGTIVGSSATSTGATHAFLLAVADPLSLQSPAPVSTTTHALPSAPISRDPLAYTRLRQASARWAHAH